MEQNLFPWLILITRLNSENLYQQLKKQKTNENAAGQLETYLHETLTSTNDNFENKC